MTPGLVTVAIPVLNEEADIRECLERVLDQEHANLEVLVADGGSEDRTRWIVADAARLDERVVLLDNPRRLQSAGLNEILARSRGEVVVRLDARSFIERDYVSRCLHALATTGAANVGGQMQPQATPSVTAQGIALANRSPWGAGPARFHTGGKGGPVDTVYLGAFPRAWLERVGGWAEDVGVNEDYELNHRLRAEGGIVWFDPELVVGYRPRSSFRALARQYARYGRSKATVVVRHPHSLRMRQVLPASLLPAGLIALAPGAAGSVARTALVLHLGLVAVAAASTSGTQWDVRGSGALAGATMHWSWAAGFWWGMVRPFPPSGSA